MDIENHYPLYMDVHVMIYVGFGFLMVFLKSYSWTAVGLNYLIASWSLLWCILTSAFWNEVCEQYSIGHTPFVKFQIDLKELIFLAEFGAGAVLITFGALLGKCNVFQLWIIASIEVMFYSMNYAILAYIFGTLDIGGAMTIHTFGAYYGLTTTWFF